MSSKSQDTKIKRFRIAFSFAGEKRNFVEKVARLLAGHFGENQILYDKYHEAEFATYDLGMRLPKLYHDESDLIVPVLCPKYDAKRWTGWEWAHIYGLLTKSDGHRVMPSRFELAEAEGLSPTAGFIELDKKTPEEFATLILERLALNEGKPKDHYVNSVAVKGTQDQPSTFRWPAPTFRWTAILALSVVLLLSVFIWRGCNGPGAPPPPKNDPALPAPPKPSKGQPVKIPPDVPKRTMLIRNETGIDIELFWFSYAEDKYFEEPYTRVRQFSYADLPALRGNLPDDQGYPVDDAVGGWTYFVIRQKKTQKDYPIDWKDLGTEPDRTLRIMGSVFGAEFEERPKHLKKE